MTDRDALLQVIRSLGLTPGDARAYADAYEDHHVEIRIAFGQGTPCAEFRVQFDLDGKAVSHAVYDLSPESR